MLTAAEKKLMQQPGRVELRMRFCLRCRADRPAAGGQQLSGGMYLCVACRTKGRSPDGGVVLKK